MKLTFQHSNQKSVLGFKYEFECWRLIIIITFFVFGGWGMDGDTHTQNKNANGL